MLKFFYNGIKGSDGKLQKCWYSDGKLIGFPEGTLTIYAKEYCRFTAEVRDSFKVENDSDTMTDYFESDRIRVTPDHPLYRQVSFAWTLQKDKRDARFEKKQVTHQHITN